MTRRLGNFFRKFTSEQEQGLLRVAFAIVIFTSLFSHFHTGNSSAIEDEVLAFSAIFLILSVVFLVSTLRNPETFEKRQLLAMIADISAVSYGMMMTAEIGALFYGIYLWVIVGNGLRYGTKALIRAYLLSTVGFVTVILFNSYWQMHGALAVGLLLTLLLIPFYIYKLLERLKKAINHAEEANKAKSQFLAHMSHEMRTPLNGVIGVSELMLHTPLNSEQQELASTMKNSGLILLKLIENVLDFSKIESGKLVAEVADFDLHNLVNSTLEMFSFQAKSKGLQLTQHFSPETSYLLRGDVQHLRQVIINLVGNAIKFTTAGRVELRVKTVNQQPTNTRLRFEVIDTGIGIAPEFQKQIFESFTQAHTGITANYGGTGLGTTISKQLVEFMGGKIGLRSEPGKGSVFWFELPFEKQEKAFSTSTPATLNQMCVLGTGMSNAEQIALQGILSTWEIQFEHAYFLSELFALVEQKRISGPHNLVILCRPQAMGMNPQDFAEVIWSKFTPVDVSLILMVSNPNEYNLSSLYNMGYSCSLKTPIDKGLLFNSLHALLSTTNTSNEVVSFMELYQQNHQGKHNLRILVAEDNGTNRMILEKILKSARHNVDTVENGEQALDKLEEQRYDLAIFDMQMPVMGGLEAAKIYRMTDQQEPRMPIVILTANATVEAQRECEEAGINAFLTKPIDAASLLDTIAHLDQNRNPRTGIDQFAVNPPNTADETAPLLNEGTLHRLELLAEGDENFVNTVCQGFFLEGEQTLQAMHAALLKQEYASFKELAHSMKGSAGNVGGEALFKICRKILRLSHAELLSSSENLLAEAQHCFIATKQAMTHYLETN